MNHQPGLRGRHKPQGPVGLRRDAEKVAGALPPLLAQAEHLAASVAMGFHGRRRAGHGENFWQYRQAVPGDPRSAVDWRRSGKSDQQFIREMEWEAAQTVSIWVDDALSMDYRDFDETDFKARSKFERAALLALAVSVLLIKAGERVALMGTDAGQPRAGRAQLNRMALALASELGDEGRADYGVPPGDRMTHGGRAVFFSDFLGDLDALVPALAHAADQGVRGCFVQVLDESEEELPVRRADDLREHGRLDRVRDPAGAGAAGGLPRAAGGAPRAAEGAGAAPRLADAVPPHQPAAARGAALALHGARRAGVRR